MSSSASPLNFSEHFDHAIGHWTSAVIIAVLSSFGKGVVSQALTKDAADADGYWHHLWNNHPDAAEAAVYAAVTMASTTGVGMLSRFCSMAKGIEHHQQPDHDHANQPPSDMQNILAYIAWVLGLMSTIAAAFINGASLYLLYDQHTESSTSFFSLAPLIGTLMLLCTQSCIAAKKAILPLGKNWFAGTLLTLVSIWGSLAYITFTGITQDPQKTAVVQAAVGAAVTLISYYYFVARKLDKSLIRLFHQDNLRIDLIPVWIILAVSVFTITCANFFSMEYTLSEIGFKDKHAELVAALFVPSSVTTALLSRGDALFEFVRSRGITKMHNSEWPAPWFALLGLSVIVGTVDAGCVGLFVGPQSVFNLLNKLNRGADKSVLSAISLVLGLIGNMGVGAIVFTIIRGIINPLVRANDSRAESSFDTQRSRNLHSLFSSNATAPQAHPQRSPCAINYTGRH